MANLEISGEEGKKLNASRRSLESLGIEDPRVRLASLAEERLTFRQTFQTPQDALVSSFDEGQVIELWQNGARLFRGTYLYAEPSDDADSFSVTHTVVGPWWWMKETPLTGLVDDGNGGEAERASLLFPNGDLVGHIRTLLERAIALNVPIQIGDIEVCYDIPQITLKKKSIADGLAELMARLPDGVMEADHSGTGLPKVHVHRRGSMAVKTLTRGLPPYAGCNIRPRIEHRPKEVKVTYTERNSSTGKPQLAEQIAGTASGKLPDKQLVTVSGDELGSLPDSGNDIWHPTTGTTGSALQRRTEFGEEMTPGPSTIEVFQSITTPLGTPSNDKFIITAVAVTAEQLDGSAVPAGYDLFFADLPDWLVAQEGLDTIDVSLTGDLTYGPYNPTEAYPAWLDKVAWTETINGYSQNVANTPWDPYERRAHRLNLSLQGKAVKGWELPAEAIVRFDYVRPPADFAANLLDAQDWMPYEGPLTMIDQDLPVTRPLSYVYNIANYLPGYDGMRALPQSADLHPATGTVIVNLGPPARQALTGMVERVRQNQDDNIVVA